MVKIANILAELTGIGKNGKYIAYIAIFILFAQNLSAQSDKASRRITTIVIDPGHGGRDPGAMGKTSKEKDIALAIGLKIGKLIGQRFPEVKIIYTRSDDRFIELYQRADIANKAKADLFISVHANSTTKQAPNGVEFWVLGTHKADENLEVVKKENAALMFEQDVRKNYGFDPNSPEGSIIMTMKQSAYLDQSIHFAKLVEGKFAKEDNQLNRGTKQAGFIVLYKTSMPSILVEVGFISNPDEEQYISNETGQDKIAHNIANAFGEYKLKYESGVIKSINGSQNTANIVPPPALTTELPVKTGFGTNSKIQVDDAASEPIPTPEPQKDITPTVTTPSSSTLSDNTIKKKIVIDEEMDKYEPPTKPAVEPKVDVVKPQPVSSTPIQTKSTTLTDNSNKKRIVLEEEVKPVNSSVTNIKTVYPDKTSKSKVEDKSKAKDDTKATIVNQTIAKIEKSEKSTTQPNSNVPSYLTDAITKKEIVDNTKKIGGKSNIITNEEAIQKENKEIKPAQSTKSSETQPSTAIKPLNAKGVCFKVQLKASSAKVKPNDPILSAYNSVEESFENNLYKYLAGNFKTEADAQALQQSIREKGIKDAFVVKYQDGIRIK